MARIGLIACSATKLNDGELHQARDLYQGDLFSKARAYVERECDSYLILSALHNTLLPTDLVRAYDYSIRQLTAFSRPFWARKTFAQLELLLDPEDTILCLASAPYREWAEPTLTHHVPWLVETPLAGMGIGQQKGWLLRQLQHPVVA